VDLLLFFVQEVKSGILQHQQGVDAYLLEEHPENF
jgi:hypothetical protein